MLQIKERYVAQEQQCIHADFCGLLARACFQALHDQNAGEWKPPFAYRL